MAYIINKTPVNVEYSLYSAIQTWNPAILPKDSSGNYTHAFFPKEYMSEFYKSGKKVAGCVTVEYNEAGDTVTSITWNEEGYQKYLASLPAWYKDAIPNKINELSRSCEQMIYAGVDVTLTPVNSSTEGTEGTEGTDVVESSETTEGTGSETSEVTVDNGETVIEPVEENGDAGISVQSEETENADTSETTEDTDTSVDGTTDSTTESATESATEGTDTEDTTTETPVTTPVVEHFDLTMADQTNLSNAFNAVVLGATEYPYHCKDGNCKVYTAQELATIYITTQLYITSCQTKFNQLKQYVLSFEGEDESKSEELAQITMNSELTGEYLVTYNEMMKTAKEQIESVVSKLMTQGLSL